METIRNTIEIASTSLSEKFDISARENANLDVNLKQAQIKNTRESQQPTRAYKSQFLIVDEEWW